MKDPLDKASLTRTGRELGHTFVVKEVTGSTNDDLRGMAEKGAAHGTAVIADRQETGRGRLGRKWSAPSGSGVLMSVLLRPGPDEAWSPGLVTLAAGAAAAAAVRNLCGIEAMIKWPNDVRVHGKKLAGILAEAGGRGKLDYVVLGIGINVNLAEDETPEEIRRIATSISMETGKDYTRSSLVHAFLDELEALIDPVRRGDSGPVLSSWKSMAEVVGKRVKAEVPGGTFFGRALGVREDGALLILEEPGGGERAVIAGDVTII